MNFFSKILEKLGVKKKAETTAKPVTTTAAKPATAVSKPATPSSAAGDQYAARALDAARATAAAAQPAKPAAVPMVDVVSKLEGLAAANSQKLDWKVSIVDLLKLLDIDSSLDARKELATELGCPAEMMGDSAKMNTWLHKTVLQKIAENGGNIPRELLD
jgi:hypothetical protein